MKPFKITAATHVFGVIGNPVAHSMGPLMHNRALSLTGLQGVYVAFRSEDIAGAIAGVRALNIRGVSITIPHKRTVMPLLDAIDAEAEHIGAVNTIVNRDGRLLGVNTDGRGALAALENHTPLKGKSVMIVGAGGAARAIGASVVVAGGRLTIVNRSTDRGQALAAHLGCDFQPLSARPRPRSSFDVLINTTPVGMWPHTDQSPVPDTLLQPGMLVMDIVYNPLETRLLQAARRRGCIPIDGLGMFVHQGALQFELWTDRQAPVEQMRLAVIEALREHAPPT